MPCFYFLVGLLDSVAVYFEGGGVLGIEESWCISVAREILQRKGVIVAGEGVGLEVLACFVEAGH